MGNRFMKCCQSLKSSGAANEGASQSPVTPTATPETQNPESIPEIIGTTSSERSKRTKPPRRIRRTKYNRSCTNLKYLENPDQPKEKAKRNLSRHKRSESFRVMPEGRIRKIKSAPKMHVERIFSDNAEDTIRDEGQSNLNNEGPSDPPSDPSDPSYSHDMATNQE